MPRILAIDYGAKRTGLAVSDPLGIIASPLDVIPSHTLEDFLKNYFENEDVSKVVIGMPINTDGSPTNATSLVQAFINRFKNKLLLLSLYLSGKAQQRAFFSKIVASELASQKLNASQRQRVC